MLIANKSAVRNFEIAWGKLNVVGICASGHNAQKWITELNTAVSTETLKKYLLFCLDTQRLRCVKL